MKIVIVGDGKIGSTLAEQLSREGHEITIIDRSGEPLQQTSEDLDTARPMQHRWKRASIRRIC